MNIEAHTAYRNAQTILENHGLTPHRFHRTWRDLSMLESSLIQAKVRLYEGLSSLAISHGMEAREAVEEELCKAFTQVLLTSIPGCARKYAAEILGKAGRPENG
jgi:hypothetical protein